MSQTTGTKSFEQVQILEQYGHILEFLSGCSDPTLKGVGDLWTDPQIHSDKLRYASVVKVVNIVKTSSFVDIKCHDVVAAYVGCGILYQVVISIAALEFSLT